ncbi:uncharacterized protein LOC131216929 [Magnolia sinica]|uniref:uncharacterized protein LOC131216929 n=1 Tax=Magnolia sinica TaxID=86752 RepID=UPI00265B0651|nr:uncharacterized protein LOC131216929 [Magnolia sinica]
MALALTDYERRRLENIKRNDQMMASLKLHQKSNQLSSAPKRQRIEIKGYETTPEKKPKTKSPIVIRRSLRSRGIPPDASTASGVEDDLAASPQKPTNSSSHLDPLIRKLGRLPMQQAYSGRVSSNRQLIDTIMDMSENVPLTRSKKSVAVDCFDLGSLVLKPDNIARMLPARILSVAFFPSEERTMVVVGDKLGNVGFWDVDCEEERGNGVYLYSPHSAPISGISVEPILSKISTSSYDGYIRLMDVGKETFNMVYSSDDAIFSLSQRPHDVKSLYFGVGKGKLKLWDERAGKISSIYNLHDQRINSIDFNTENTNLMATSSTDATACIWDLRSASGAHRLKCLKRVNHRKAVHSAYFSPSGSCLATTSYDNNVGLLSGVEFEDMTMIPHYNQTSKWISTFRAIWGWDDSNLFVGNTKREVDVISTVNKTTTSLESPYMTAIPCRFAAHPFKVGTLAGATGGGQVYVWTTR